MDVDIEEEPPFCAAGFFERAMREGGVVGGEGRDKRLLDRLGLDLV